MSEIDSEYDRGSMPASSEILERLQSGPPLLLDGPTGTELQRRGVSTEGPQWSAAALVTAPEVVAQIHADYVAAGAEVLTANSFRTHRLNLASRGWEDRAAELTTEAVRLARRAATAVQRPVWVAGSQAPIADCYTPDLTPQEVVLAAEHLRMAEQLAAAGVDLILVETHPTLREALAATRAALSTGVPVVTSFVCGPAGRLLSGESLGEAAAEVARLPVAAVCVNCIVAETVLEAVRVLRAAVGGRCAVGAYANVGFLSPERGWVQTESVDPRVYQRQAAQWLTAGARLMGSCCGTTPEHIRCLAELLQTSPRMVD